MPISSSAVGEWCQPRSPSLARCRIVRVVEKPTRRLDGLGDDRAHRVDLLGGGGLVVRAALDPSRTPARRRGGPARRHRAPAAAARARRGTRGTSPSPSVLPSASAVPGCPRRPPSAGSASRARSGRRARSRRRSRRCTPVVTPCQLAGVRPSASQQSRWPSLARAVGAGRGRCALPRTVGVAAPLLAAVDARRRRVALLVHRDVPGRAARAGAVDRSWR